MKRKTVLALSDLISDFDKLNEKELKGNYFIAIPKPGCRTTCRGFKRNDCKERGDKREEYEEEGLYIATLYEKQELKRAGLQDMCPKRKQNKEGSLQ